jgi:hypothetical protein
MNNRQPISTLLGAMVFACCVVLKPACAQTVTISFTAAEGFSAGQTITAINAITTPLGLAFDAANQPSLMIVGSGPDFSLQASAVGNAADILANFDTTVNDLNVVYPNNPPKADALALISGYSANQDPNNLDFQQLVDETTGIEPTTLSLTWTQVGPPQYRALQIELGGPGDHIVIIDSIQYARVCRPEDINGDGVVNVLDLIDLLLCFGQSGVPPCNVADINADGTVNVLDLIDLLLEFGTVCP